MLYLMRRPNETDEEHEKRVATYTKLESERQQRLVDAGTMEWFNMGGYRLLVHAEKPDCHEHNCVIHNPSTHCMNTFPLHWRGDRGLMERICPHGIGHPDPDDLAFKARTRGVENSSYESVHGCDGCCTGEYGKYE
jgi:hypothetical protein